MTPAQKELKKAQADNLKAAFLTHWRQLGGPELEAEYKFHPVRKWRFDYAIPARQICIELEGGTWQKGKTGHTSGKGYAKDCQKYNEATILGWRVFRLTADMLTKQAAAEHLEPIIKLIQKGGK